MEILESAFLNRIYELFFTVASEEDKYLQNHCGKGIFFVPELAITYLFAKRALSFIDVATAVPNVKDWQRELVFKDNPGPVDLVFNLVDDSSVLFEFKIGQTADAYLRDVDKLRSIKSASAIKIFCAIVDTFSGMNDSRIKGLLETSTLATPIFAQGENIFRMFETTSPVYKKKVTAVVSMWKVCAA